MESATSITGNGERPELPPWRQVVEHIATGNYQDGHIFSEQWMADQLGIDIERGYRLAIDVDAARFAFLDAWGRVQEALLVDHCIALDKVRGGFLKVPPQDQAARALEAFAAVQERKLRRAQRFVTHVRYGELTPEERAHNMNAQALLARQRLHAPKPVEWRFPTVEGGAARGKAA